MARYYTHARGCTTARGACDPIPPVPAPRSILAAVACSHHHLQQHQVRNTNTQNTRGPARREPAAAPKPETPRRMENATGTPRRIPEHKRNTTAKLLKSGHPGPRERARLMLSEAGRRARGDPPRVNLLPRTKHHPTKATADTKSKHSSAKCRFLHPATALSSFGSDLPVQAL